MAAIVERATADDFQAVAALDAMSWGDATFVVDGEHTWRIWCDYSKVYIVRSQHDGSDGSDSDGGDALADTRGIAAAAVIYMCDDGRAMLHKIMVHPACRGQGLGTDLLREALSHATTEVLLTVDPANRRAAELYKRLGFETLEHIRGFYREHEHRDLMVWKPGRSG